MALGKYTWKEFGISATEVVYNMLPEDIVQYEEWMYMSNDYERAYHKDNPPPK